MDGLTHPAAGAAGPLPAYRARLASGELTTDPSQALAAERLQGLWISLRGYDPAPERPAHGFFSRLLGRKRADDIPEDRPHGLYLVGDVGRGKSMLMDLFFETAEVRRKRRVHFHRFMQEAHRRSHAWRQAHPDGGDPIPPVADAIAAEAALHGPAADEVQADLFASGLGDGGGAAGAPAVVGGTVEQFMTEARPAAFRNQEDAPGCPSCGSITVRAGSCYSCPNCGTTTGCG